jgi:hypothetical protein
MTNFQKLARSERSRVLKTGRYISLGKAQENVAEVILSGFASRAEAKLVLEGRELRDVIAYMPSGETVFASDLAWAIDFAESGYLFYQEAS